PLLLVGEGPCRLPRITFRDATRPAQRAESRRDALSSPPPADPLLRAAMTTHARTTDRCLSPWDRGRPFTREVITLARARAARGATPFHRRAPSTRSGARRPGPHPSPRGSTRRRAA